MQLAGQGIAGNRGYAMVMLLVAMGVMAVVWTTALPAWSQLAKREKEEELIFRGNQYARAIGLFQRKYANQSPPSLDVLLEQKFLRRKYKDPMVADGQFQLLYQTVQQPGSSGRGQSQSQGPQGRSNQPSQGPQGRSNQPSGFGTPGGIAVPGQVTGAPIIGVTSKSKEESLRTYNGATHYNEWQFIYLATTQQPGAPGGPGAQPDGRGRGGRGSRGEPFELGGRGGRGRGSQEEGPDGRRMFGPDPGRGRGTGQPPSRGFGFPPSDSDFDFPQPPPPPVR
ncbi:MAG: type II secretion system protein [Acidobacteria bacterium]|nr:MAG: type II secretion system protein [Acidobacteriota bacterium]